ncbi:Protein of unknown function DUF1647 family-containing protein [Aphelenchoides bicaudatus]|nr:Protein of unknown function DUF1647 family-containing protein [Aphelenchoides bicaudatus]
MAGIRAFRIMFWPQAKFVYISRLFGLFCIILIVSQISLNRNNDFEQTDKQLVNEDCLCNGENFCFKGLDSNGSLKLGRRFDCSLHEGLKVYKLLDSDAQQTPLHYMDKSWQPVFATAVSSNHIGECRTLIKRIRSVFPNSTIVLYDIGLTREQVREVASWCKVERKVVNFSSYPAHLKNLKTYAFKLVLIDMLQNYTAFFYYDSSVHIRGTNLTQFVSLVHNGTLMPFSTHTFASHNIISVTHPGMYDYLPINPNTGYIADDSKFFDVCCGFSIYKTSNEMVVSLCHDKRMHRAGRIDYKMQLYSVKKQSRCPF